MKVDVGSTLGRSGPIKASLSKTGLKLDETYSLNGLGANWYKAKPYGFKMNRRDGTQFLMFLPISPSNLTISTNFATNIVPTLYGTVEEHSDVRYYDISIEGTTGMAPQYTAPQPGTALNVPPTPSILFNKPQRGRKSFEVDNGVLSSVGLFPKSLALAKKAINKAADVIDGGKRSTKVAFYTSQSGYTAFHNLYRFLINYKKDTAGSSSSSPRISKKHPLIFFNYKDNNQYNVVVRNFTLRRSAENPMLYYYNIQMRGYNLETADTRVDTDNIKDTLANLGLDGVKTSSIVGDIKKRINDAKSVVGTVVGGVNVLGR